VTKVGYYTFTAGDADSCRVKTVTRVTNAAAGTGPTWHFEYNLRRDSSGDARVTDPLGYASADRNDRVTRYFFDEDGRVTKTKDALRRETSAKLTTTSKVQNYTAASNSGTTPNASFTFDSDDNQSGSKTPAGSGSISSSADFGAQDGDSAAPSSYTGVSSGVQGSAYLPGRTVNRQDHRTYMNWTNGSDTNALAARSSARTTPPTVFEPGVAKATRFQHDKDGKRTKTAYPNGVVIDQAYDDAKRLIEVHAQKPGATALTLQRFRYRYADPSTQRETPLRFETIDDKLGKTTRYDYDGMDRLTSATIKSSTGDWAANGVLAKYAYALDATGSATSKVQSGSELTANTTNYLYNAANQLCWRSTSGAAPPASCPNPQQWAYDKNGNQLSGNGTSASYSLADQMTSLTVGAASPMAMVYYGSGQDRWSSEGGVAFQHNVLGVGSRGNTYFTRDDAGKLVSRRNGTSREYYVMDALGSVTGVTDGAGALVARHDYEPYGKPAPTSWATGSSDVAQGQFGFAGGYRSTGGLYHFGQRWYDPEALRWTQLDPLDQSGDLREGNRYLYAGADPVNLTDPNGMDIIDDLEDAKDGVVDTARSTWRGLGDGIGEGTRGGMVVGCAAWGFATGSLKGCPYGAGGGAALGSVVGGAAGAAYGAAKGYVDYRRRLSCRRGGPCA